MSQSGSKKRGRMLKWIAVIMAAGVVTAGTAAYYIYSYFYKPNTAVDSPRRIYIRHGATFDSVMDSLRAGGVLKDEESFEAVARRKLYPQHVKSGSYEFTPGMSNLQMVRRLISGSQSPVKLTFNNIRTAGQLAQRLAATLEMDSLKAMDAVMNDSLLAQYGLTREQAVSLFIPNTYEIYWDITPQRLMARMKREHDAFWNSTRKDKLQRTGLTQAEASTLASIVEEETIKRDEQPTVAGLYINRLRKGMKLESDPTVKFAVGNFAIKRVLNRHLETDSPYNTYKYAGLPPGPIRVPSINAIDAVLNYAEHNYIYMCAKEDFSGYHNFAETAEQHNANAHRYRQELNRRKIYR